MLKKPWPASPHLPTAIFHLRSPSPRAWQLGNLKYSIFGAVWCGLVRSGALDSARSRIKFLFSSLKSGLISCISWLKWFPLCLCHLCAKKLFSKRGDKKGQKVPKRVIWPPASRKRPRKICLSTVKKRSRNGQVLDALSTTYNNFVKCRRNDKALLPYAGCLCFVKFLEFCVFRAIRGFNFCF